jgi:hypothetical protein
LTTHLSDNFFKIPGILLLIRVGNGADLVVVSRAENAAHLDLVCPDLALSCGIQILNIAVYLRLNDRSCVLSSLGAKHNHEVPLCLHAQIATHVVLQSPAEHALIFAFDGIHIGIRAPQEHVVQDALLGANTTHCITQ